MVANEGSWWLWSVGGSSPAPALLLAAPPTPSSELSLLGSRPSSAALLLPLGTRLTGRLLPRSELPRVPPSLPEAHTLSNTSVLLLPPALLPPGTPRCCCRLEEAEATEPCRAVTAALVAALLPGTTDDAAVLLPQAPALDARLLPLLPRSRSCACADAEAAAAAAATSGAGIAAGDGPLGGLVDTPNGPPPATAPASGDPDEVVGC